MKGAIQRELREARDEMAPPRIAVADDDPEMRSFIAGALRKRGYEVLEATDGTSLLALVTPDLARTRGARAIEVVVTDLRMKGATGMAALQAIRRVDPALPVILITAFPDPHVTQEAMRLGAAAVLAKPYTARRLLEVVEEAAPRSFGKLQARQP